MTGYTADEVLGRNCRFLQGRDTDPARVDELRRGDRASSRPATVELRNYRKDGTPFWNEVHISPVRDARGEVVRFVGVQVDVSAYREEQRRLVREQTARVAAQAAERRSAFLAEASPLLDASLDLRSTLDSLTRLSVPFLGDVCIVDEIHLNDVRRLAAAAADPAIERLVRELPEPLSGRSGDPIARVVETGRSEILTGTRRLRPGGGARGGCRPTSRSGDARAAQGARAHHRHRRLRVAGPGAPLRHRGPAAGRGPRPPRGARAGQRAALRGPRRRGARAAGRRCCRSGCRTSTGVELAARFRPAGDGSLIGGDFYDVLPVDGGVDLVIGDVTGKGARAAALTSLVRHTVRTAARYEATPSRCSDVVNRTLIAERSERGRYCTVAFCRVELNGVGAGDDLLRRAPAADGHARLGRDRARRPARLRARLGRGPEAARRRLRARAARVARAVHRRRHRGAHDRRRLRPRRAGGPAARGGGRGAAGIAARVDHAAALAGERRDDVAVLVARRGGTSAG